jgi:hypothetical protein
MTQDEVCAWLLSRKAREYDDRMRSPGARCFQLPRMADVPLCGCNEKPPSLHVIVFPNLGNPARAGWEGGVEFEVVGQAGDNRWLKAIIYSCRRDEVADVLVDAEYVAKQVWTTFSDLMNMRRPPQDHSHDEV